MPRGRAVTDRRRALERLALAAAGVLGAGAARAQARRGEGPALPRIDDLRTLTAQMRRDKRPLLLFFSTAGCPFCIEVRRNYLAPRVAEQAARPAPTLLIREVDITSRAVLVDAQGRRTTEAEFASRFGIRVTPVVALFDDQARLLGDPLVGIDRSGFYETYLARAIESAERRLRG